MDFFHVESEGKSEALRIYQSLCDARVLVALHALADILDPVQRFQKTLQERGLSVYKLMRAREQCMRELQRMRHGPRGAQQAAPVLPRATLFLSTCTDRRIRGGTMKLAFGGKHELSDFPLDDDVQVALEETGVVAFLDTLCTSLEKRFKEECDAVVERFQVLDPAAFDASNFLYGQDELRDIANHFSPAVVPGDSCMRIDFNQLIADWCRFKLSEEYAEATSAAKPDYCNSQETFWGKFFLEGSGSPDRVASLPAKDRYCELWKVVCFAMIVITNNAESERAFSCMKRICTDERSSLTIPHLQSLMLLSRGAKLGMTGEFAEFHRHRIDWEQAWRSFAIKKHRRPGDMAPVGPRDVGRLSKMERRRNRPRKPKKLSASDAAETKEASGNSETRDTEEQASEKRDAEDDEEPTMTEVVDWGPDSATVYFIHDEVDQTRRSRLIGLTFVDEGEWWVILELGYNTNDKELYIFYMEKERVKELFPGYGAGDSPTFTAVFKELEAQTQAMSEEELGDDAIERPLDAIQWTRLSEAEAEKWV
jgi:hypothetical protein